MYPANVIDEKRRRFLEALQESGNVSKSCEVIGVSRAAIYMTRKRLPGFAKEWEIALEVYVLKLEDKLRELSEAGSERSLHFYLKSHKPETYNRELLAKLVDEDNTQQVREHAQKLLEVLAKGSTNAGTVANTEEIPADDSDGV